MNLSKKFLIEIFWNNVYFQHSTNSTTMSDYFMNRKSGNGLVAPWRAFSQPLGQIFDLCSWPQSKVSLRAQSMQYAAAPITKLENCCNCSKSKILGPKAIFTLLQMVSKLGEDNFTKVEKISRNIFGSKYFFYLLLICNSILFLALCSRKFQNVKLRLDFVDIW